MKTKMRPRYYCDHCNKGSGSPSYMKRHELGCTANPKRVCGMCKILHDSFGDEIAPSRDALIDILDHKGFDVMYDAAKGCPACILSVIRTKNRKGTSESPPGIDGPEDGRETWSYKEEKEIFWKNYNDALDYDYY